MDARLQARADERAARTALLESEREDRQRRKVPGVRPEQRDGLEPEPTPCTNLSLFGRLVSND